MGQGSSKNKGEYRCPHCSYGGKPPKPVGQAPNTYNICTRCHGLITAVPPAPGKSSSKSSVLNPLKKSNSQGGYEGLDQKADEPAQVVRLPLDRIHIAPFYETLPQEHQQLSASINYEEEMMKLYLTPFFTAEAAKYPGPNALQVQIGMRFQINEVDWKVVSAYPPAGYVSSKTSIRCMTKPLSAIATIQKLHLLPVMASLPTQLNSHTNEPEVIVPEPNELFREYVRPWIADTHGGPMHKASNGSSSSSSSSSSVPASSSSSVPASASSSNSSRSNLTDQYEQKHIVEGDMFISKGVQFKVISCLPTNGIITNDTEIFTNGPPLTDIEKMQIHPIYESMPNSEKSWSGKQLFEKYLLPHFQGRFQYVKKGDQILIDGVDFKVVNCDPMAGLVTSDTLIFNEGPPLRAEDLRRQQMEEDEAMARNMQMAEEQAGRAQYRGGGGMYRAMQITTPEELRARLQQVLRMMPPDDPHRPVVQRLFDQLGHMPPGALIQSADRSAFGLLRAAAGQAEVNRGASQADIEALPTRIYHAPATTSSSSSDGGSTGGSTESKERVTCMVCLMEYEDGDELRTLPCFHASVISNSTAIGNVNVCTLLICALLIVKAFDFCLNACSVFSYHKDCIDNWLKRNKTCAICKNPICS